MSNRYHISLSGGQQWVGRSGIIAFPSNQVSYPAIIHSAHLCLNVAGPSGQVTVLHLCTTRVKDGRTFHLAVARLVSSTGPHQVLGLLGELSSVVTDDEMSYLLILWETKGLGSKSY